MKHFDQWVNWRLDDAGRKIPVNPRTLGNAGVNYENSWASFPSAVEQDARSELGVGFVLTENDPYTCVDLDKCVGRRGAVGGRTRDILDLLQGWVELSPSGTGLHVWVRNEQPISCRTKGLEVYSYARWMTVTGRSNPRATLEIPDRTAEVEELLSRYMPATKPTGYAPPPNPEPLDDLQIWDRLFYSDRGDVYMRLYDGDLSPSQGDHSLGVIMLANQLAWLTDFDAARMKRLLYETGLARPKWEETARQYDLD